ncbi:peptide/nickel transport system permease protein [Pseudooceanicola antarcticus]|uniref:ABC transporter permease n=1 Tax=Pseudooceanicola antarcticus TaxID=1247613 RepID=A0A285JG03_9RHOB|nr:ABC transporter permease [Pseudooceanicola antarcticus]PJE26368.1 ABC transporter permease [Pseudooceanicola antarcticus]SNY59230.1 peptide/nickel transport system permease protein [Pseudooceanicola antarcticus]
MLKHLAGRLAEALVALVLMSLVIFLLSRVIGDPVALLLSDSATEADRQLLIQQLGLDRPMWQQYFTFLGNALQGDFGQSVTAGREDALELVLSRLPASLSLAGVALAFTLVLGILLGVLAAITRGTLADLAVRMLALLGQSAPSFWLGIMLIYVFAVHLGWLPTSGFGGPAYYVLPALTLGLFTLAAITRLVRASMLEALSSEYVKLARIKGLSEWSVVLRHALGNSLIPVVTFMGTFFATMITGAVVVETVFAWPGIGRLAYESIMARDFPVIQTVVLVITAFFILANLIVDLLYLAIDPRMRAAG